jgi:hypothetical protein
LYLSTTGSDKTVAVSVLLSIRGRRAGKERGEGGEEGRVEEGSPWIERTLNFGRHGT